VILRLKNENKKLYFKMLLIENYGKRIYVFNKNGYEVDDTFMPYFYYKNDAGEYTSIFGEKLSKVYVDNPKDVPKERNKYENHHEADVVYINRYIIDKFDEIEKEDYRIFYFDIELAMNASMDVENVEDEISVIGICNNEDKLYHQFVVSNEKIEKNYMIKEEGLRRYYYSNEKQMLESFKKFVIKYNPNMFVAWFGDGFDYPYLLRRMEKININIKELSVLNWSACYKGNFGKWVTTIKGRILFDLLEGYKKISQGSRESYSLDYISKYELGEEKEKFEGTLKDLRKNNFDLFLKYNLKDVRLLVLLDEKLRITNYFDEVRRFAHCQFTDVYSSNRIHNSFSLFMAKKEKIVLLSIQNDSNNEKFQGSFCKEPKKGLHKNVAVFDLKSLYPNIIRTMNLSPETFSSTNFENCVNIGDKYFYMKTPKGFLPKIIDFLLEVRNKKKKQMEKYEYGSIDYRAFDMLQYSVKVIANSLYGVVSNSYFRLYKKEIPQSITYVGREIVKFTIKCLEDEGIEVIYADTDSAFIKIDDMNKCFELKNKINKKYDEFVKRFGITEHSLEIEFEKYYERLFFKENTKKRYAGLLVWKDGKDINIVHIMGFESRRSDSPQVIRNFQKTLFEMILRGKGKDEALIFVEKFKESFYKMKEEIGIPIGMNTDNEKSIHIRASNLSNKRHGTNFKIGDKIKYIYVNKNPPQFAFENVIAFVDKIPEGYSIDYDKMWNRLVQGKVDDLFKSLEWDKTKNKSLFGGWN